MTRPDDSGSAELPDLVTGALADEPTSTGDHPALIDQSPLASLEQVFDTGSMSGAGHAEGTSDDIAVEDRAAALARLRSLVDRTRPVSMADQRTLPVLPGLEGLLPGRGLQRGSTVQVGGHAGATALALAMAAGPTRAGSWVACVGLAELGWAAAAEAGVDLDRVAVVRTPDASWGTVTAALVDAFDVVLCGLGHSPSSTEARRLTARARERGSVLILVGGRTAGAGPARRAWPGAADVELSVISSEWSGIGVGWGRLGQRRVTLEVGGRRGLSRARRVDLWLPGPSGVITVADVADGGSSAAGADDDAVGDGVVTPLRRVG